jgi:hypothetical protein
MEPALGATAPHSSSMIATHYSCEALGKTGSGTLLNGHKDDVACSPPLSDCVPPSAPIMKDHNQPTVLRGGRQDHQHLNDSESRTTRALGTGVGPMWGQLMSE